MAHKSIALTGLVLMGLALHAPLHAEDAQQPAVKVAPKKTQQIEGLRWGVQAGVAFPITDTFRYYSNHGTGFMIGGQATWDWEAGKRWRARVDYTAFPKVTVNGQIGHPVREDNTISGITGGIDFLYFWSGKSEGLYSSAGLALANWKQETNTTGSTTDTSLGLAAGLGWQFNPSFGLELRTTWSRWKTNIVPETIHNAGTFNIEGSFRF